MDEAKLNELHQMIAELETLRERLENMLEDDGSSGKDRESLIDALDYVEDAISSLEDIL